MAPLGVPVKEGGERGREVERKIGRKGGRLDNDNQVAA